ncbi:MAG: helix-turn-helix domain-containing protein [Arcanobacterium sp.]|nr:helix-turn-helix domain-containing protein [Arcanobacterium sp.]MDY6142912.1 helix-turn-helix domain-containing protein [Arcanobacterium sp.]
MSKPVYTVADIAELTGFSQDAIRRAITQNYVNARPEDGRRLPRLRAKKGSRRRYLVLPADVERWVEQLEDA